MELLHIISARGKMLQKDVLRLDSVSGSFFRSKELLVWIQHAHRSHRIWIGKF